MRLLIILILLALPSIALAQDTGEAPEETDSLGDVLSLPTGTSYTVPGQPFLELSTDRLAFSTGALELDGVIRLLPPGSFVLVFEGESWTAFSVSGKFWLLPDSHYRKAIVSARQLAICQPALDEVTETSLAWQKRSFEALGTCEAQFDKDEELIQDLTEKVQRLEERSLLAEKRLSRARTATGVAVAVTSGVVLGVVAAGIVSANAN